MANLSLAHVLASARQHHAAGNLQQAEAGYRQVLAQDPRESEALYLLGLLAYQVGNRQAAADLIGQSIAIRPVAEHLSNLGFILRQLGQFEQAISVCEHAISLKPDSHEAHNNLGFALEGTGRVDDAIAAYFHAANLKNDWTLPLQNAARLLRSQNRHGEAVTVLQRVIAITGPDAIALNDLGVTLHAGHRLDEAAAALRESIRLAPTIPEVHNNLANVLHDTGRVEDAIASFREAVRLRPEFALAHSNLLYAMHFDPACDPVALLAEHRNWARLHAEPLTETAPAHVLDGPADRRLRIGYLSRDLHDHPVGRFLLPILEHHRHERFEIICYYDGFATDQVSTRLRTASHAWHDTGRLTDAALADLIRSHRMDVLFDLAVHAPGNRLLTFARKPAPIQITYLGYPGTTGMSAMDYRITDAFLDPPGVSDSLYSERSLRPASNYWCYAPNVDAPDVFDLPARRNGFITFGCLNNFAKTNRTVLSTWATLLGCVSGARLLVHAYPGSHREDVLALFRSNDVDPARVEFVGGQTTADYLATYNRIDIALDPFPYHGGTTTCDALWMGVPIITLAGKIAVHRAGVSLLTNVGLPELIADTPEQYVQIAADLAGDIERLGNIRETLRQRMQQSPLCDAKGFTRNLEAALEQAWHRRLATID